ncbi:3-oxoacyl-[acyl-carrier-protein] synthase III C-terminal domain-containing protein [uncultured Cellulomonas sp.]|uniref:3-oxoacyl-ACP synthase III family protein n=1 Tax=uncultured Cellulomonas sp. TaxID=189682 RepID=UPI0028E4EABF|nr:3-oxoacyl-[acyl-carrier-protein] synthase III C-terminal domain-containing protein [uncultured Cellulomonas sp.]
MFGIVALGTTLGAPYLVADVVGEYSADTERILGYGYTTVHRAPADVGVSDLALAAAQNALDAAGVSASELDLLVLGLTDVSEYLYWDAAAALQSRLGARRAEAVVITQACTASLSAIDLVAGRLATRPDYTTALVIGANRCCEPYWNRMQTQSMVFSDGAAAAVLRRGHDRNRWLASELLTDGRFADFYRMDVGGAARPFTTPAAPDGPVAARDAWDIMEFFDYDDGALTDFARLIDENAREVVDRACGRAGLRREDLDHVILLHDNRRAMSSLAAVLGVDPERTNLATSLATGHVGAADQLLSLADALNRGRVSPGDRVALVGVGRGMHWACTLLEA